VLFVGPEFIALVKTIREQIPSVRTIITTEANELCQPIHDRMPVILAPENYGRWLDVGRDDPADLLRPYTSNQMRAYPISTRVNSPDNDDVAILEPLAIEWAAPKSPV